MHNIKKLFIFIPSIEDGGVEKNLYIVTNFLTNYIDNINIITFNTDKKKKFNNKVNFICTNFSNKKSYGRYFKYFFCLILLYLKVSHHEK